MNAIIQEMYAALQMAHYEFLTLEPRLTSKFRDNVRKAKERCKAAITAFEAHQPPAPVTDLYKITEERAAEELARADLPPAGTLGHTLAMRVLQSDLYGQLDDEERAECDALIGKRK